MTPDQPQETPFCVLVSAGAEWRALKPHFPGVKIQKTPYGECFETNLGSVPVVFLHGGWGKVAAAASTQYAIDHWLPARLVNLGTCGGFAGRVERGEIVLAERTVIYDIVEQMTDAAGAIRRYSVDLDLSWLTDPPPQPVLIGTLVSADRDILSEDIPMLVEQYQAAVADWESGAIAWVAARNQKPCLILRGVTDLVEAGFGEAGFGEAGFGEAYGNYAFFEAETRKVMNQLLNHLPAWLAAFGKSC